MRMFSPGMRLGCLAAAAIFCCACASDGGTQGSASPTPTAASPSSSLAAGSFRITGDVKTSGVRTVQDLRASTLPSHKVDTTFQGGSGVQHHTYEGPLLLDVLNAAGPVFDAAVKSDRIRHYALVTASDGYQTVISWGEIDPDFANESILLATSEDGRPLDTEGPRLVVPEDSHGGRYVTGVTEVRLASARTG